MAHKSQKGFAVLEALLIVLVLAVIGGAGYYVWHSRQDNEATPTKTTQTTNKNDTQLPAGWKLVSGNSLVISEQVEDLGVQKYQFTVPAELRNKIAINTTVDQVVKTSYLMDADCNQAYAMEGETGYDGPHIFIFLGGVNTLLDDSKHTQDGRTRGDYYASNKSAEGNFYVDPYTNQHVYKIGQTFVSYVYRNAEKYVTTQAVVNGKVNQGPSNKCYEKYHANFEADKALFTSLFNSVTKAE
jgi:hypothetical protein